jgi:hypothetical protein
MPVRLEPPVGLPLQSASVDEEAWSSLVSSQLEDFRKAAENWRNGLAAVIGLITILSVVKGPDEVRGLDRWAAYTVGSLVLLALACATLGAWASLTAAYGVPSVLTRERFRDLGGIVGYKLELARRGASRLRLARVLTLITLVLLGTAVAMTWYGPRSTTATLDLERRSLPGFCGRLVGSRDGYLDIKTSGAEIPRVYMTSLLKVRPVDTCSR